MLRLCGDIAPVPKPMSTATTTTPKTINGVFDFAMLFLPYTKMDNFVTVELGTKLWSDIGKNQEKMSF
jgi:hypothetical protein